MYSTSCPSFKLPEGQVYLQPNTPSLKESPFLELVELAPAIACSFVATSYIIHAESTRDDISSMNVESPTRSIFRLVQFDFLNNVSPGLALGSCLVLGCCLSSYVHRRRDQDQYQTIVFVIWITWSICIGWRVGASANMVTLGVIPWAACAAMLSSFFGHVGARWFSAREKCECQSVSITATEKKEPVGSPYYRTP